MTDTPEYQAWQRLRRRCLDPADPDFPDYGGAGITVCPEWAESFLAFFRCMGPRPTPEHSVDRRDGGKGYEPGNCRWATKEEQAQNRPEFVHQLSFRGRTMTVAEWARELGVHPQTLYGRLRKGWPVERILAEEPGARTVGSVYLEVRGERLTLAAWARRTGLRRRTIKERLCRGWTPEDALEPLRRPGTRKPGDQKRPRKSSEPQRAST